MKRSINIQNKKTDNLKEISMEVTGAACDDDNVVEEELQEASLSDKENNETGIY